MSFGGLRFHLKKNCSNMPNVDNIKELIASVK